MVASSPHPVTVSVTVDGRSAPQVTIRENRLYTLFNSTDYDEHELEVEVPNAGLSAFTFTFS